MTNAQPNGRVIYRGPSLLDGAPLVVIAIGFKSGSTNRKTGDMVQTYILRDDVAPTDAIKSGQDSSICGDCPHRGTVIDDPRSKTFTTRNVGRTCYVNVGQGPLAAWRTYKSGGYPDWDGTGVEGKFVRLGTYGDPAAVPASVWESLLKGSAGHTGYTHQWRSTAPLLQPHLAKLRSLCMASVDTVEEAREATRLGWRYFRVVIGRDPELPDLKESLCPASAEAGRKLTCAECLACGGADGRRGSIYIPAHGGFAVMANVRRKAA